MANIKLKIFENLCFKCKEIIFNFLNEDERYKFFQIEEFDDFLINLSPIEQILYIANNVIIFKSIKNSIVLNPQAQIEINNNDNYFVDFFIDSYTDENLNNFFLNKPIIIELDGFEYHSSKKQTNYDYERENKLKLSGYDILRFTGSQIYNSPFECLNKIIKYASKAERIKE